MTKRICFDDKIEADIKERVEQLRKYGIKNPSRPFALRSILDEWRYNRAKMYRKPKSKEFAFK